MSSVVQSPTMTADSNNQRKVGGGVPMISCVDSSHSGKVQDLQKNQRSHERRNIHCISTEERLRGLCVRVNGGLIQ